jgi:HTH-type transcriptional regulator/antitoxin HigA
MEIRAIKTKQDYEDALARVGDLMDAKLDTPEGDELDILGTLVEAYEEKNHSIPDAHPIEVIRFMMEQNGLIDKDLEPFLGSSGRISEVMSGKRMLSIGMIRNLHAGLKIPAEVLIQEYKVA